MTLRRTLLDLLAEPRSVSSLARALGLRKQDVEAELQHALRTARAAGHRVVVVPARCRTCGFVFGDDRLVKPGRCPACRGERLQEALLQVDPKG